MTYQPATDVTERPLKGFHKLQRLKCWPLLLGKVKGGVAPEALAEWVQVNQGEYLDAKQDSLVRMIYRLKNALTGEIVPTEPSWIANRIEAMNHQLNEGEELKKLYLLQLTRIAMAGEAETRMKFLIKSTSGEIKLAQELLKDIVDLKFKLGILKSEPTRHELGVTHREAIAELAPEDRAQVGNAAKAILDRLLAAGKPAEPLEGQAEEIEDAEIVPET